MDKPMKKVQTYYIKVENIDFLNNKAFSESTADNRVTDDALLDRILDQIRLAEAQSPAKQKKSHLASSTALAV